MKLSKLREKTFPVVIDFGDGDIVNIEMKPHVDGQAEMMALQKKFEEAEDNEETAALIRERFCRTIPVWDMQDDDGNVIPLTSEGLVAANVPVTILGTLLVRGYGEINDSKKPGKRR